MHKRDVAIKKISRLLGVSKNTVRSVIRGTHPDKISKLTRYEKHLPVIKEHFERCSGNVVRVQQILREEHNVEIPYPSLTWLVRQSGLREPPKKQAGSYSFAPGAEMQHDTSPYKLELGGKKVTVQCASLVLAYSRRIFIQFYPRFTRFEARVFLTEAARFMDGTCKRCTIDNTSVLVAHGSGPDAEIAPEVKQLGSYLGIAFVPHAIGHSDRKARVERPFYYVEKNFLAGREFTGWQDLNAQGVKWCREVANQKPKRALAMSPEQAYIMEKPHLNALPSYIPPVYVTAYRVVDTQGYVSLDTNRYSVSYKLIGKKVEVQKHTEQVLVYFEHQLVAKHKRELEKTDTRVSEPGHRAPYLTRKLGRGACLEENLLSADSELLAGYVQLLKSRSHGRGVVKLKKLLFLKRTYPKEAFMAAIDKALHYKLYDLERLEKMILSFVAGDFFDL